MAENDVGPMRPRADSNQVSMKRNLAANGGHTTQSGTSLSRRSSGRRLSLVQRKLSCDLQEDVRVAMSNSEHRGLLYDGLRNGTSDSEYERVERWLDEHPDFVADYFVRKADYRLVSAWVDRRGAPSRLSDENWERTSPSATAKNSDSSEPAASPGGARVAFALDLLQPPSADASKYTVKAHEALWLSSRADDSLARLVAKADSIRLRPSMRHSVSGMSMPSSRKVSLNSVAERPSWHSELDERIHASLHNGASGFDRCDEPLRNGLPNGLESHSRRKSASTRSIALSCADCSCQSTENSRFWCELLVDLSSSNDDVTRMGQRVALAICQLLGCESASIFTVAACADAANAEDAETKRADQEPAHLVCRALNVRSRTTLEDQAALASAESDHHSLTLRVGPAGGLVGIVAQTGEPVRLEDAYSVRVAPACA